MLKAANLYGLVTLNPSELEPQATITTFKPAYVEEPARAVTRANAPPEPFAKSFRRTQSQSTKSGRSAQEKPTCATAPAIWEAIQNTYGPSANHGIASNLYFQFNNLQMEKEDSIQQWIGRLRTIQEQLEGTPYTINDKIFRDKLLHGTQTKYEITTKPIWTQLVRQPETETQDIIDQLLQVDTRLHPNSNLSNTLANTAVSEANLTLTGHRPTQTHSEVEDVEEDSEVEAEAEAEGAEVIATNLTEHNTT
ncbi:hypothetical protein TWF481_002928 [Arthrobotrys musiformis]|uniref:Retrotransposon gag domain-containing protein n=1 Tax=Arthrobotrys musiformis TaxID=47236 RepID=A0AAV9VST9_9PEZI